MALEKIQAVDRIEVLESGIIQVRIKTAIMEEDKQISCTYHRHVIAPGDDYNQENAQVKAICEVTHTAKVVQAYLDSLA